MRKSFQAAVAIVVLLNGEIAIAATMVGGFITSNTYWRAADSPFIATSSVLVDSGATLTIDPGVEVRFAPTTGLVVVNGTLSARGSLASPIKFAPDQAGDAGRWNGIRFGDNAIDAQFNMEGHYLAGSIIEYVDVSGVANHSNGSIRVEYSNPFIHASAIHDNLSSGVVVTDANGVFIVGNDFRNNVSPAFDGFWGGGIRVMNSTRAFVSQNAFSGNWANGGGAVYLSETNNSSIVGNLIEDNFGATGVTILRSNGIAITENVISGQKTKQTNISAVGISIQEAGGITFKNNAIRLNSTGLHINDATDVSLEGDTIADNGEGIRFVEKVSQAVLSANAANPTVIRGNDGYQIYNGQFYEVTTNPLATGNVDARNVWWGSTNLASVDAGIFDFFDDSFKGIVFRDPIAMSEPSEGDFNGDGSIDAADYVTWRNSTGLDYDLWRRNFGRSSSTASSSAVPEPSALLCLLLGGITAVSSIRVRPR